MAFNTKRTLAELRSAVRLKLRETDGTTSYWTDDSLNEWINDAVQLWTIRLNSINEGYTAQEFTTPIVDGQIAYVMPDGADLPKQVMIRLNPNDSTVRMVPLVRDDHWSTPVIQGGSAVAGQVGLPRFRLVGEYIYLEPAPQGLAGQGAELVVYYQGMPPRLTSDNDTIPTQYPNAMETVVIYETALFALGVEGAQGGAPPGLMNELQRQRDVFAGSLAKMVAPRTQNRVFSQDFYTGD